MRLRARCGLEEPDPSWPPRLRPRYPPGLPPPTHIMQWKGWRQLTIRTHWAEAPDLDYWVRCNLVWRPKWRTDSWWAARNIVWARGWRLGPIGFSILRLLSRAEIRSRFNAE